MKTGLQLCFDADFRKATLYYDLYLKYVKFVPKRFANKSSVNEWQADKHLKSIQQYNTDDYMAVGGDDYNIFLTVITGSNQPHRSINLIQDTSLFRPENAEIEKIIDHKNFVAGYLYNEEYELIQSTKSETNFRGRELSPELLSTIKNTPYKLGIFNHKEYQTRFNPANSALISFTWLMIAWKMWFGESFFKLVPKAKILSFPHATEIKELPNGQVYVQLYDKLEEPYTPENIFRQWKWKEWIGYDELIDQYA